MKTLLQMHFVFPLDGKYQPKISFWFSAWYSKYTKDRCTGLSATPHHIPRSKRPTAFGHNFSRCKPIFKTNRFLRKPFRYSKSCRNVHHTASVMWNLKISITCMPIYGSHLLHKMHELLSYCILNTVNSLHSAHDFAQKLCKSQWSNYNFWAPGYGLTVLICNSVHF